MRTERAQRPYRRLSITLLVATGKPFELDAGDGPPLRANVALVAPGVERRRLQALDSDLAIWNFSKATAEYAALAPLCREAPVRALDPAPLARLAAHQAQALQGALEPEPLRAFMRETVEALAGAPLQPPALNPRLASVLEKIEATPLDELSPDELARGVHLSASRLRHLFSAQMGCSIREYARWCTMWNALWRSARGRPLIEVAVDAGFHDLAHLNRVFNEAFGRNPTDVADPARIRVIRCGAPGT